MTCTSGFNELINFCVLHEYLLHALVEVDARPYRITTLSLIRWVIDCSIKLFLLSFRKILFPQKLISMYVVLILFRLTNQIAVFKKVAYSFIS